MPSVLSTMMPVSGNPWRSAPSDHMRASSSLASSRSVRPIKARAPLLVGYSDFTAFELAYLARGGVSFAGPSAGDFGAAQPDAFTLEHFFGLLQDSRYAIKLALDGPRGEHRGRLWGGNLSMVTALLGTRHAARAGARSM